MKSWQGKDMMIMTGRLSLRPLQHSDAQEVLEWINNEEIVKNFQFFTGKVSTEEELRYIFRMADSPSDLLLGIVTETGELIGTCGLHEIDWRNDTARLGVIIGKKEHWDKGYAREAICALLNWAFSAMNLHKVYLNVFTTNIKSFNLYRSIGFRIEGLLSLEYQIRGEYVDMHRMAVIKEEWEDIAQRGL